MGNPELKAQGIYQRDVHWHLKIESLVCFCQLSKSQGRKAMHGAVLLLMLLVAGVVFWYKRRVRGAKGFQHQRMTNGAMNVEIGNPTYKMYEGGEPDDVGGLLDADFALDPDKPTNFTNPVYATLYMGGHGSRHSLASTDEKRELLGRGPEDEIGDPLA